MILTLFTKRAAITQRRLARQFKPTTFSEVSYALAHDLVTLSFTVDKRFTVSHSVPISKSVLDDLEAWALEAEDDDA